MVNPKILIPTAMVLAVVAVIFSVVPMIGDNVDTAYTPGATSQWNVSVNTDLPTGSGFWTDTGGMVAIGGIIIVVAAAVLGPLTGLVKI